MPCDKCDGPGNPKTYENQAALPLEGRIVAVDSCIHHIVAALNAGGVKTVASCCGHELMRGNIVLEDGRTLLIIPTPKDLDEWGEVLDMDEELRKEGRDRLDRIREEARSGCGVLASVTGARAVVAAVRGVGVRLLGFHHGASA